MATSAEDLLVRIVVDSAGAVKGFKTAEGQFIKLGEVSKKTEGQLTDLEKNLKALGFGALGLNQGLELAKKAFSALASPVQSVTQAYLRQEAAQTSLSDALKITKQFTQGAISGFQSYADSLSGVIGVSSDVILKVAAIGKQVGLSDAATKKYIERAADLSAVTGDDLTASFRRYMDSLKGNVGALSQAAPEVLKFTALQGRAGEAADYLGKKLAGRAAVDAKTFSGALLLLNVSVDKLKQTVGKGISDIFGGPEATNRATKFVKGLTEDVKRLTAQLLRVKAVVAAIDWKKMATGLLEVAGALAAVFAVMKVSAFIQFTQALGGLSAVGDVVPALKLFAGTLSGGGMVKAIATVGLLAAKFIAAAAAVTVIVGALDILFRNLNRIPQLAQVVGSSFAIMGKAILRGLYSIEAAIQNAVAGALESVAGTFLDVGGSASKALEHVRGLQMEQADMLDKLNAGIGESADNIKKYGKDIDTGFLGQIVKGAKGVIGALQGVDAATKGAGKGGKKGGGGSLPGFLDANQMKQVRDMISQTQAENAALGTEIANVGAGALAQIDRQVALDQFSVDLTMQKLKAEGLLTDELKAQLEAKKSLIGASGDAKKENVKNPGLIDPTQLELIKQTFGNAAGDFASVVSKSLGSMATPLGAVMGAVNGVLDFVQQLIDFVPQVLEKIANIFNSLTDLPNKLVQGIQKVVASILNLVANLIPNLLNAVPKILDTLISGLIEKLPDVLSNLIRQLPTIIEKVVEQLPKLADRLIHGLITGSPKIAVALVVTLVKEGPKIAMAIMKTIYVELPKAIVNGIVEGVKEALGIISDGINELFGGASDAAKKAVDDVGKAVTGISDNVFKVVDFVASAKGTSLAEQIRDAIGSASQHAANILGQLWDALKNLWSWVYDHVIKPLIDGLVSVWHWILDNVVNPIVNGIRAVWQWVYDHVISPFVSTLEKIWNFVNDKIVAPLMNVVNTLLGAVSTLGQKIADGLISALTGAWESLKHFGFAIRDGLLDALESAWENLKHLGHAIIDGLLDALKAAADQVRSIFKDALGGLIPGSGGGGPIGFSNGNMSVSAGGHSISVGSSGVHFHAQGGLIGGPKGPDQEHVYAEAGEFMMKKRATDFYGLDFMNAVNNRTFNPAPQAAPTHNEFHITLQVQATQLDDAYVRNKLAPTLMQEIKRASLDGRFVIDAKGIRR